MTRRFIAIAATVLAATALTTCAVAGRISDGHLDIEQAELQARITPRFPTRHCEFVIACLDLSNPVVVLADGADRIGLTVDARVQLGGQERTGRIGFSGRPRYVPVEGQLFLDDLRITKLEFAGLPEDYAALVKLRGPALINSQLRSRPVYTIDDSTAEGALAKLVVRDVKVVNGKLRISFVPSGQ